LKNTKKLILAAVILAVIAVVFYRERKKKKVLDMERQDSIEESAANWVRHRNPMDVEPMSENFSLSEFATNDGTSVPSKYWGNVQILMDNLEIIRKELGGKPISINSGYRHPAYNKKVNGVKNSLHLFAMAADIVVQDVEPKTVQDKIAELIRHRKVKAGGLGRYSTFTHYDVRGYIANW
jgi:uncharacterized protein YcbK (DUF882 family)